MAGNASGFCVYNDPAIAIAWLLGRGAERIAYVDVDAHHGDGVERAFWNDPRVLTIGPHEHPDSLFPATGYATDTGGPHAEGSAVNVALPAVTGDAGWLRAFHAVVPPLVRQLAADRGRRLRARARARGAPELDPPAVRSGGPAARPGRRDTGASPASTSSVSAWAALRASSVRSGSSGYVVMWP
jgi:Histone deacetylase domain